MVASPDAFSNLDFVASENSNQKEKFNMKEIIIITGASSGFGALTARALAKAGHMVFGPAEAFTPEQLAELYDVNVLSTQRVNRAALPQLRKQRRGLVVWV